MRSVHGINDGNEPFWGMALNWTVAIIGIAGAD